MKKSWIIKGDLCYSLSPSELNTVEDGYLIAVDGVSQGVFQEIPEKYRDLPLVDCRGKLVIPGLVDLHVHAPQYTFRGLGMDLELLDWLNTHTFPEESKYRDLSYADRAYRRFVEDLKKSPNTRSVIFATLHREATLRLMELLEASGLSTLVGKVNMDRNAPDSLREETKASIEETKAWIQEAAARFTHTRPILTPRFTPSCTDELMEALGEIQRESQIPVQSHLSENPGEIAWVKELCPWSKHYGDAYDHFGLFGGEAPTIMAHCVYSDKEELQLMKERGVFVAHCPASNTNLSSGIAPVRRFLDLGIPTGLGSDVAGGTKLSIFQAMADAIGVSKLRWRLVDDSLSPLSAKEAFYLGTLGGGAFFGKVGSFEKGYAGDVLVVDDSRYTPENTRSIEERLERTIYLSEDRDILHKYVEGQILF